MPWRMDLLGLGGLYSAYETSFPDALIDTDFANIKDYSAFYDDTSSFPWAPLDNIKPQDMYRPLDAVTRPTTTRSASNPQQLRSNAHPSSYAPSQLDCYTRPACNLSQQPTFEIALLPATATTSFPILGGANQELDAAQHEPDCFVTMPTATSASETESASPSNGSTKRSIGDQSSEDEPTTKARKVSRRQLPDRAAPRPARTPHKLVERRYRDNLKGHLDRLSMKLPLVRDNYPHYLDVEDSERAMKLPSKAIVIAAASQYIDQLEIDKQDGVDFVKRLQLQVEGLQKMVKCDDCAIMQYMKLTNTTTEQSNCPVC